MAIVQKIEKNSVVIQTSKMEFLEKIVKIFKEIPRKLTSGNSSWKVAASKALISMQKDSTREKIWRRKLLRKSAFKVIEKEKTLMDAFKKMQFTENGWLTISCKLS